MIGTASYADQQFEDRPTATTSLRGMHSMLVNPQLGGWRPDQITEHHNPRDCRHLAQSIRRIAEDTTGALLLYFVGHGTLTRTGELILALSDT